MIFGGDDQPDYTRDLSALSLGQIARTTIDRYLHGDPPTSESDFQHEARDPAAWRRYTVRRTRWRIAQELENDRREMIRDMERQMLGLPPSRPRLATWCGQGDAPWSHYDDD